MSIDRTVGDIAGSGSTISVVEIFSLRRVMGIALMLAVVQVVLVTALATLAAFLYNLAAGLVGGFEVTLVRGRLRLLWGRFAVGYAATANEGL